jgi:hypothetical protein
MDKIKIFYGIKNFKIIKILIVINLLNYTLLYISLPIYKKTSFYGQNTIYSVIYYDICYLIAFFLAISIFITIIITLLSLFRIIVYKNIN